MSSLVVACAVELVSGSGMMQAWTCLALGGRIGGAGQTGELRAQQV